MIIKLQTRYVVVAPSGVEVVYITLKTKKEQLLWQGLLRAGVCSLKPASRSKTNGRCKNRNLPFRGTPLPNTVVREYNVLPREDSATQ